MADCVNCNKDYSEQGYSDLLPEDCTSGCSRLELVNTGCVLYDGIDIPCLGIYKGIDTVRTAFIKIFDRICQNAQTFDYQFNQEFE